MVALNEAYDGDLLTLSVNDLVFDGTTVDVAMNVQPKAVSYTHLSESPLRAPEGAKSLRNNPIL